MFEKIISNVHVHSAVLARTPEPVPVSGPGVFHGRPGGARAPCRPLYQQDCVHLIIMDASGEADLSGNPFVDLSGSIPASFADPFESFLQEGYDKEFESVIPPPKRRRMKKVSNVSYKETLHYVTDVLYGLSVAPL